MKLGINAPLFDTIGTAATFKQRMNALHDLDIKYVRLHCPLYNLNTAEGVYNVSELTAIMTACKKAGIEVLMYIVGTPLWNTTGPNNTADDRWPPAVLSKYVDALVYIMKLYPWCKTVQIWNEMNGTFWLPAPDVAAYVSMLQAVKTRLSADSTLNDVKIVMGGTEYLGLTFMQQMHAISPLYNYLDVVCNHPYIDPNAHWTPGAQSVYSAALAQNNWLHDLGLEVWATEFGMATYPSAYSPEIYQVKCSEADHANYMSEALSSLKMANYDRVYYFRLDDRTPWDANDKRDPYYGVVRQDGSKKPAYDVFRRFSRGE